jgi:ABC-type bacteriocin/lantibiotic exporter with double-glycine peptidase domain
MASTPHPYRAALLETRWPLAGGITLAVVQSLALLPLPLILQRLIFTTIGAQDRVELWLLSGAVVVLTAISAFAAVGSWALLQRSTKSATAQLRRKIIDRVFDTDLASVAEIDVEEVNSRLVGDTSRIEQTVTAVLRTGVPGVVLVLGLGTLMVVIDPLLTLVLVAVIPVLTLSNRRFRPGMSNAFTESQAAYEHMGRLVRSSLHGQLLLRAHGIDDVERERMVASIMNIRTLTAARLVRVSMFGAWQSTVQAAASSLLLAVGGLRVMSGAMSTGALLSFVGAVALIRGPGGSLLGLTPTLVEGRLALGRVEAFVNKPLSRMAYFDSSNAIAATGSLNGLVIPHPITSLALHDVSYAYRSQTPVIDRLTLHIDAGRTVALAGANGTGKSTTVALLLGLLEPTSGTALVNGVAMPGIDGRAFRRQVGIVLQHAQMLPGTLRHNLLRHVHGISDDELWAVLAVAEATEIVANLPGGLDFEFVDEAGPLSGGERQRIAIARALVGGPTVLVLDEPSNHLPVALIERVMTSVRTAQPDCAIVLISHDPAVLELADDIMHLARPAAVSP